MLFSDQWRSLWPIAAIPHAPNLLSGDQTTNPNPLNFHPSPPNQILFTSPSLSFPIPSSSSPSILRGIQSFFRRPANNSFLPTADLSNLAADIQSSPAVTPTTNSFNNLHALPCHDKSSLLLFFPAGDNSDEIGFLCLRFGGERLRPEVGVDAGGDVFKQREGLKHPRHRIVKLCVVNLQGDWLASGDSVTEGFLVATTLYSANWFRVETRRNEEGRLRPALVPIAKQGFESCVVDACWSPHLVEESAVLLESGEIFWFDVGSKRGGSHKISLGRDDGDGGRWLGCRFGGQPFVVLVASSVAVVLIDLRPKRIREAPRVLAKVGLPDFLGVVSVEEEKDGFRAFCGASFNFFHFAVVSERLLLLFDVREPLVPVLSWDHGLEHPTYVSMFKLSEFGSREEFKLAFETGFVILVGSFWTNEFKFFCYGFSGGGAFGSSVFAWELPSSFSVSGKPLSLTHDFVREMMSKEKHLNEEMRLRKEGVAGFCIVPPDNLLKCSFESGGFVLIRLMLSGKLEIQEYHSSCGSQNESPIWQGVDLHETEDFTIYNTHEGIKVSSRFHYLKLLHLSKYMDRRLSNNTTLPKEEAQCEVNHLSESYLDTKDTPNDENLTTFSNCDKSCHLDFGSKVTNPDIFDVSPVKLDFESDVLLQPSEQIFLKSLKRQASKWLESHKS